MDHIGWDSPKQQKTKGKMNLADGYRISRSRAGGRKRTVERITRKSYLQSLSFIACRNTNMPSSS